MYQDVASERETKRELHLFTRDKIFKSLIKDDIKSNDDDFDNKQLDHICIDMNKKIGITIHERNGAFYNLYYDKRIYNMGNFIPTDRQNQIICSIKELYKEKKSASIFISGVPGSGKSMIGFLLAVEINAKLVRTFNPTDPGDTMIRLIRDCEPDEDNPLIIMLDEADVLIRKITEHTILPHKNIPIMIHDKISFNRFMDDMIFYNNVILILTSNEPKENIDAIDSSFLRKGRINQSFVL
jgi:Cdc6-like AAA superfamily ATPase